MQQDFRLSSARLKTLRSGAVIVQDMPAVILVQGSGALTCLQGLLTQDLMTQGPDSLVYGALLTPKGMIVTDLWTVREEAGFVLAMEASARPAVLALLARTLPPRLAQVTDLSEAWRAAWLIGGSAPERLARALGRDVPGPGRAIRITPDGPLVAGGSAAAPFSVLALGPAPGLEDFSRDFLNSGGHRGDRSDLAAARVMAGWPTLGSEIDEKTLPQEVRFDENGGVSYTKGCYIGQETVARVHFRGRVNRTLRGLLMPGADPPAERTITLGDKDVGALRTVLLLDECVMGLAMVRREVENGTSVTVGAREAQIAALPFDAGVLGNIIGIRAVPLTPES